MSEGVSGRCLCGAVRFRFDGPPLAVRACWCRDCQYLAAGNATVNAIFRRAALTLSGETRAYVSQADSGTTMHRRFCLACGTPLFSEAEDRPELMVVRVGTLENPERFRPEGFIWTASAPSWGHVDPHAANCAGQPPPTRSKPPRDYPPG